MTEQTRPFAERLPRATDGLVYQSETDAPVEPFAMTGFEGAEVTADALVGFLKRDAATPVATETTEDFFSTLTAIEDWYGDEERATARRYRRLSRLLTTSLTDVKVFKVGERSLDIYVVGRSESGEFAGITTKAVET